MLHNTSLKQSSESWVHLMTSLEDAILVAKCAVDEGETLIINRSNFASRKRGRLSVLSRGRDRLEVNDDNMQCEVAKEVAFWREKYESLRSVNTTADGEFEAQLDLMTERESKLEKYVQLLEKKVDILSERNQGGSGIDLEKKLDGYRRKISFFETMTSMTVKCEEEEEYVCTIKNKVKKIATRFRIKLKVENDLVAPINTADDVRYAPMANSNLLPEYLQSEISFETNMAPILMGDILQSLYDDAT